MPQHKPTKTAAAWPWMLNDDLQQIPPLPEDDNRPLVKDLIAEHQASIAEIRSGLQSDPLYESEKHDDLWILRFWLSHGKAAAAITAAKKTLEYRKELGLDQWDIRNYAPTECMEDTMVHELLQYWDKDALVFLPPDFVQGPMVFFKLTRMDQHQIVQDLTEDYWFALIGHCAEWSFQWADYISRKTGRLTKATCTFDAAGATLGSFHSECSRRNKKCTSILENFYPQTLESINVFNTPLVLRTLWKMASFVMPSSVTSKVNIFNPHQHTNWDGSDSAGYISDDSLPKEFGTLHPLVS